ncbi:MAG TPA: hypothetical protein PK282_11160 [Rhodoglobus sp.]|nr:hypothetical protein [Rhodoglobus sp.]
MSLTPGFILAEDHTSIGLTLTEIAVIVAEWDAGPPPKGAPYRKPITLPSEHGSDFAPLEIEWRVYRAAGPGIQLERGDVRFYLCEQEDIAEMRQVLAGQGAA